MANETPESDFPIECFQNYSAPEVFIQGLAGMVNQGDVETIIRAQKVMLQRFEKTTEMLTTCNQLSASRIKNATAEFKQQTQMLLDMKNDLNFIFRKIRAIKSKLSTQYPEAYQEAEAAANARHQSSLEADDPPSNSDNKSTLKTTASTETLKPSSSTTKSNRPLSDYYQHITEENELINKTMKRTSSSETEGPNSEHEISSD